MKIIVHDYAGHPFQVQLSRKLAARGHEVLHLYCESTHTPRGELVRRDDDPSHFDIRGISLGGMIPKNSFVRRYRMEAEYARRLEEACSRFDAEVILSGNTPTLAQHRLAVWCRQSGVRLVSWVQDVYGLAAYRMLRRKLPGLGHLVGKYFIALDKATFRLSDAVVVISEDFKTILTQWGIDPARVHTIHNWAPLESMPQCPRANGWAQRQRLGDGVRFVYSGTLSMRHNPALLIELARLLDRNASGELIVVSEGAGVEWLAATAKEQGIKSLRCLGFQPFDQLPEVLGSADVLVAILEPDAGVFCVPSKVLSYFCAGRAVLLAVPTENLASRIVMECGAGLVVEPGDVEGFCQAARQLIDVPQQRADAGAAARRYAETHFDIERITDQFEALLAGAQVASRVVQAV